MQNYVSLPSQTGGEKGFVLLFLIFARLEEKQNWERKQESTPRCCCKVQTPEVGRSDRNLRWLWKPPKKIYASILHQEFCMEIFSESPKAT
jgi:hypothetical protein